MINRYVKCRAIGRCLHMELQPVSIGSVLGMMFSLVVSFGLPIGLFVYLWRKKKASFFSFATGLLIFLFFVLFLESIVHSVVLGSTGTLITGNIFLYALYGALMAALFEETGRFLGMKYIMRNQLTKENAWMYGVGHGGIEAMFLLGITSINNLVNATMINNGSMNGILEGLDQASREAAVQGLSVLWQTPASLFFAAGFERIIAICLQISLSILIYQAVKEKSGRWYGAAFGVHFVVDFAAVLLANVSVAVAEVVMAVMTAAVAWYAAKMYRAMKE